MTDQEVLDLIKKMVEDGCNIYYTTHAVKRMKLRKLKTWQVKEILLNPKRLIRREQTPLGETYKIQGGSLNRKVAVRIQNGIVIITVM